MLKNGIMLLAMFGRGFSSLGFTFWLPKSWATWGLGHKKVGAHRKSDSKRLQST
jgi:hypothetical protein